MILASIITYFIIFIFRIRIIISTRFYTDKILSILKINSFRAIICTLLSWSVDKVCIILRTSSSTIFKIIWIINIIHTTITTNVAICFIIWKCIISSTFFHTFIFLAVFHTWLLWAILNTLTSININMIFIFWKTAIWIAVFTIILRNIIFTIITAYITKFRICVFFGTFINTF